MGSKEAVYQIVTIGSDGSENRWTPVYAERALAVEEAKAHEDTDERYIYNGRGRWTVKIERLELRRLQGALI